MQASDAKHLAASPFLLVEDWFGIGIRLAGQVGIVIARTFYCLLRLQIDWQECVRQAYFIGVNSFLVVGITSLFTGLAMSLQIAVQLVQFGGESEIGGVVALALIRQIGPITAARSVAGRVGSSIAAELTTMNISEQIDALKVMRIDPIRYLVVPRFVGAMAMMPVLSIYAMGIGIFAGMVIALVYADVSFGVFLDSVRSKVIDQDFYVHFLKAFINAAIVIFYSCTIGLNTKGGAADVGYAVTRSVVWSMTVMFIVNYIVTDLTYEGPR
ncbi:MAG: ABC transporter permease [Candidatus Obscuribacterales bacterium]|nr:ABC transporter permease [Candidatus Obscuribacterales bacterium]